MTRDPDASRAEPALAVDKARSADFPVHPSAVSSDPATSSVTPATAGPETDVAELLARHRTAWIGYAAATDSKWVEEWERRGKVAADALTARVATLEARHTEREAELQRVYAANYENARLYREADDARIALEASLQDAERERDAMQRRAEAAEADWLALEIEREVE